MDYEEAARDLKDIKATLGMTTKRVSRDPAWFFLIQGLIWLVGFLATQFYPSIAGPLWIALNAAGVIGMTTLGIVLGRRPGRRQPGLASRIVAIAAGVVVFDALIILSFGLTDPRETSLLIVLSTAFCYFVIGLTTRQSMSVMGAFIALSVFAVQILLPSYLYLAIAVLGGGSFIASAAFLLLRKERADD